MKKITTLILTISLMITLSLTIFSVYYSDGVYTGTAAGRNGEITVDVEIRDGKIVNVDPVSQKETPMYWKRASALFQIISEKGTTDGVDVISGASKSSRGIINAVNSALENAQHSDCDIDGHDYGEWIYDGNARLFKNGTEHQECKNCGHANTRIAERTALAASAFDRIIILLQKYLSKILEIGCIL